MLRSKPQHNRDKLPNKKFLMSTALDTLAQGQCPPETANPVVRHTSKAPDRLAHPVRFVPLLMLMLLHPHLKVPAAAGCGCHVATGMVSQVGYLSTSAQQHAAYNHSCCAPNGCCQVITAASSSATWVHPVLAGALASMASASGGKRGQRSCDLLHHSGSAGLKLAES